MSKKNTDIEEEDIPENVLDPDLYRQARLMADESYKSHSAYKSMFMVRKYKELGGEYAKSTKKQPAKKKTKIWREEEWIQITPYLDGKKKIRCGNDGKPNACRPLKNISGQPKNLTMKEIIDKWGKEKVRRLTELKLEDMGGRLDWLDGTFTSSDISKKRIERRKEKEEEREMKADRIRELRKKKKKNDKNE